MIKRKVREKLLSHVKVTENGCWEWQACRQKGGNYGMMAIDKKVWLTHRVAWKLYRGPIPKGIFVCHHCDNPPCCNPDHLFLGTTVDNTKDRHKKGRDASGQQNGNAKLTNKDVKAIRKRFDGQYGQMTELAKEFGVSVDQIRNVVRGEQRMTGINKVNWATHSTRIRDLTGRDFGYLHVLEPAGKIGRNAASRCRCQCGVEKVVINFNLLNGSTVSCGCYARKRASTQCKEQPPRLNKRNQRQRGYN